MGFKLKFRDVYLILQIQVCDILYSKQSSVLFNGNTYCVLENAMR